jgi:uncharacterized protein DUF4124
MVAQRERSYGPCLGTALVVSLVSSWPVHAQIFKCVDASGRTTYQQSPCPSSAKGGRVELFIDNGRTDDSTDPGTWESLAQQKNVVVGMPRRFVLLALGAPRITRAGRGDENANEVWSYPRNGQTMRVGMLNGVVTWIRYEDIPVASPAPVAPATSDADQRAMRRRAIAEGEDCDALAQALGAPDRTDDGNPAGLAPGPIDAQSGITRYTWEPAPGDPNARTTVTCTAGRVTNVERSSTR